MNDHVLVVDDMGIFREPIAAALTAAGFNASCANGGADALDMVDTLEPSVILLDLVMPGMSGLEFLAHLRDKRCSTQPRVIILTASTQRESILRAAYYGVNDYLLKSNFSLSELVRRVHKALHKDPVSGSGDVSGAFDQPNKRDKGTPIDKKEAIEIRPGKAHARMDGLCPVALTKEETLQKLESIAPSQTMAGVVEQILRLSGSGRSDLTDIAKVIESDPILSSRLLQLANSAAFASQRARISNVDEAIRNIGVKTVHQLAMSIGVFESFPKDESDGFNIMRCWQHCYATAIILNVLMEQVDPAGFNALHLTGLCHDLGDLLLRHHFATEFKALSMFASDTQTGVESLMRTAFGMSHPELVSDILTRIGMPAETVTAIREFFDFQDAGSTRLGTRARALSMANSFANALQFAASPEHCVTPILRSEWRILAEDKPAPLLDYRNLRSQILTTTNMLARLSAEDEARLLAPLQPRTDLRIWMIRHQGYLDPDPIELAFHTLANVTLAPSFPTSSAQWSQFDAMVIMGPRPEAPPLVGAEVHHHRSQAGHPDFPVFFLAGQKLPAPQIAGIECITYPLSIAELSRLVASALNRRHSK